MNTPTDRFLSAIVAHGITPRRARKGWLAQCPAHDDCRPSLSIATGEDGKALVRCHAGCSVNAICAAIGMQVRDLMPTRRTLPGKAVNVNGNGRKSKKTEIPLTRGSKPTGKVFPTANDAVAELERRHGPRSAMWTYQNSDGEPIGVVVRWDLPNGKKAILPVSRHTDGWLISGMAEPRPLYRLPELANARRVYVCEGEKAVEAAASIGLIATTSPHGCESPQKADWRPLAGKEVILLPDNDEPGWKYSTTVARILVSLNPPASVKIVELPNLPCHGDIADLVAQSSSSPETLREYVEKLVSQTEPIQIARPTAPIEPFKPFPVDVLPEPIRGFVVAGAKAIGCDPSYLVLPLLTAIGAAIGNTRRIQLKRGWSAPPIIWAAIVGESGTAKSPAFKLAMKAMRKRQQQALKRHADEMREYQGKLAHYERLAAEWKRSKNATGDPPEKPEEPFAERCIVSDTTVEALAPLLRDNPRGLLLARDELAGWMGSFDRYASGKGHADAAHWLSMFNGECIIVDRKTGVQRIIFVPMAAVSVCGGIQPGIFNRALGVEHRESGLAARLLLTCPPRKAKRWTEADIEPAIEREIAQLFDRLYELRFTTDDDGEPIPVVVGMTQAAKAIWKTYYNEHAQEQVDLAGDLSAAWSKLEEYAARLALVVHFTRWAAGDPALARADKVDEVSMKTGIALTTWFKGETKRVYSLLDESEEDRDLRRLVEWLDRRGGSATAREAQMGCRWLRLPGAAEEALEQLVKSSFGNWEPTPAGHRGQPTRRFHLAAPTVVNTIGDSNGQDGDTVDVDSPSAAESQTDDDWGEL